MFVNIDETGGEDLAGEVDEGCGVVRGGFGAGGSGNPGDASVADEEGAVADDIEVVVFGGPVDDCCVPEEGWGLMFRHDAVCLRSDLRNEASRHNQAVPDSL